MFNLTYSFYIGILPSFDINTIGAWIFTGAFLLIITGLITSVGETITLKKNNLLFSSVLASSFMLIYLGLFGLLGIIVLPFIWLSTHILLIQANKG